MNEEEQRELLELWRLVPGTVPTFIEPRMIDDVKPEVMAAIARDAIMGWLLANLTAVTLGDMNHAGERGHPWSILSLASGSQLPTPRGHTRLLDLIAAARGVAGVKG